jgi:hypothetical protein
MIACESLTATEQNLIGCYEVVLGTWSWDSRQGPPQSVPPDTLALFGGRARFRGEVTGRRLAPNIFAGPYHREIPPAWAVAGDSVQLRWSNGFSGVRMALVATDSGPIGHAEAFTDVIRSIKDPDGTDRQIPWPHASVHLRPVTCPASAA